MKEEEKQYSLALNDHGKIVVVETPHEHSYLSNENWARLEVDKQNQKNIQSAISNGIEVEPSELITDLLENHFPNGHNWKMEPGKLYPLPEGLEVKIEEKCACLRGVVQFCFMACKDQGKKIARLVRKEEKQRVYISDIFQLVDQVRRINQIPLEKIEFLDENDSPVKIDKKFYDDFKFTGLNNIDFIVTEFYKHGFTE